MNDVKPMDATMDSQTLQQRIRLGEDSTLELKQIVFRGSQDRLELYSPGALPNSMTVEAMQSMSLPRNDVLSSLFARYYPVRDSGLGREYLMDRRGSGVDVILAESERLSGKKPLIEMIADMELRVTIYAAKI